MRKERFTRSAGWPNPYSQTHGLTLALRMLDHYGDRVPTPAQVMADFGCSRATAYRWIAALRSRAKRARAAAGQAVEQIRGVVIESEATAQHLPMPSMLDTLRAQIAAIEKAPPVALAIVATPDQDADPDVGRIVEVETA